VRMGAQNRPFIVSGEENGDLVLWESKHFKKIKQLKGHTGAVTSFAWGGGRLVSAGCDTIVKLWDMEKAKSVSTFAGHTKQVNDVHCDANQVLVVSSSDDGSIKLWDVRSGKNFRTLNVHTGDAVKCAKMRSSGRDNILVSGSDTGQVAVWDMHAPYCIATHTKGPYTVCDVDFDNDHGNVFALYSDGSASVFSTNTWTPCHTWQLRSIGCTSMVFTQHGLVTGCLDGTVLVSEIKFSGE